MSKVFVSFEFYVSQTSKPDVLPCSPDFVFNGEFDKDSEPSFSAMCALEYNVRCLAKCLMDLDCKVKVIRKDVSHLNFD